MSRTDHDDAAPDPVLEATRAEVIAYGMRRATMTSVAKRAGLSRATLYRRAGSLDQLVQDALVVSFERMMTRAVPVIDGAPTRADIVAAARALLDELARDELTAALLEHDPELLLPYVVTRLGRSQELILDALEAVIAAAQAGGSVRPGEPRILALGALQALTPYVIARSVFEAEAPQSVWLAEAAHLLDAYLRPTGEA